MPEVECVPVAAGIELATWRWPGAVGVPFVLVHGLASNARMWDGVADALAGAGHAAVAVDLRAHGQSTKVDEGLDVETVAADLASVIEHMELDRPVVAGQSWGGNVALELGWRSPQLVRGIACIDGGWIELAGRFPDWDACAALLAPPPLEGQRAVDIEFMLRATHPAWPETGIAGALANFERRPDGTVAPYLTRDRHMRVLRGLWEHRPSSRYAEVKVPVLLVPADDGADSVAKRAAVEAAGAALPVSRTQWFESHHDIHAERPAELAALLRASVDEGFFR